MKGRVRMSEDSISPFLKWPGGKRWLTESIKREFLKTHNMYVEPFLGSGAMFFSVAPSNSIISDLNSELMEVYIVMRDHPNELKERMLFHQKKHCNDYYYNIRKTKPRSEINRVSRFIYLNRTCFNGMYRVNRKGEFNVPIGTKNNCIYDIDVFETYSNILQNAQILSCDFEESIIQAMRGDYIFADPPYTMISGEGFVKYNEQLFTWNDQERLFCSLVEAKNRGVKIILTNACCKEIYDMYSDEGFFIIEEERICTIAGQSAKRGKIKELLISSYEIGKMR